MSAVPSMGSLVGPVRRVEITALTARTEAVRVLRVAAGVVLAVALYLGGRQGDAALRPAAARNLLPFQSLVQALAPEDQRMFRTLQVALIEAQNGRAASGEWPDVAALADQGIDPFGPDPTARGVRHRWRMYRSTYTVNYLGIPDSPSGSAWLVTVQEPDPSGPPDVYRDDEEHARLLDGTPLHVAIWRHAAGARVAPAFVRLPQAEGWTQLFAVGPSSTH